jgi:hypothetical protein
MLIAVSAILLVLGVLAYRKPLAGQVQSPKSKVQSPEGAWLLGLRVVVLLLFAAVFVGAVLSRAWTVRPKRVAVLLDVSESMSAVKAESAAAAAASGFPVPVGVARQEWAFADTAVRAEVQSPKSKVQGHAGPGRTRIGVALKTVGKTRPGAVVLLSDGQDNGEADAVAAAREIGVPVYTVGFGGLAKRNLRVERVMLPAVVYSGETVDVQVRVAAAGFADEKTRVRIGRVNRQERQERQEERTTEIQLGPGVAEQDVPFRLFFDKPGRQVIEARADSLMGESNYADNVRSVVADVRPGRVRVVYVTNRPGPGTRMVLRALASDERIEVEPVVSVSGALGAMPDRADVFILDNVVETGSPDAWQAIAAAVQAGAGVLALAGPDFQPGPSIGKVVNGTVGRVQAGSFTPDLTAEGRLLPWFGTEVIDLGTVPPFTGVRPLSSPPVANHQVIWLVARESKVPLLVAAKYGKGKVVYVSAYPLWRWGFGPEGQPEQATPLSGLVTGVVRYLAERDTSPFWLQAEKRELYHGQPVRLVMRAVAPDGRPWVRLSVMLSVAEDGSSKSQIPNPKQIPSPKPEIGNPGFGNQDSPLVTPMTETGEGVYEATLEALGPGRYRAVARASLTDTVLGRAATEFAVAEQALELANTGMNEGLLRAISEASGGRFMATGEGGRETGDAGGPVVLGTYQRRFVFDPRRAVWVYIVIALLAGAEWFIRRRKGLL